MSNFKTPRIISLTDLDQLRKELTPKEIDIYSSQLEELQRIDNPSLGDNTLRAGYASVEGVHVYYPWLNTILYCVNDTDLLRLRTNRNRELITTEEQTVLRKAIVGIAGMSVGSGMAVALAYSGISRRIKIADHDVVDTSNLNRLRETLVSIGRPKVDLTAEHIYELDPFACVDIYSEGITADNIDRFFEDPKLDMVIDEIDDFKMKVQLRLHAKKNRIPLLMLTSLGDNILVDIERYDQDPEAPIFHGMLGDLSEEILAKGVVSPEDIKRYSIQLVGQQYIPTRAIQSVFEMGKTLVGRPQLYSTIAVDGGLAAYVVRQILLNNMPKSGRFFIKFSELFNIQTDELASSVTRDELLRRMSPPK